MCWKPFVLFHNKKKFTRITTCTLLNKALENIAVFGKSFNGSYYKTIEMLWCV